MDRVSWFFVQNEASKDLLNSILPGKEIKRNLPKWDKKIEKPEDLLNAVQNVQFLDLSLSSGSFNIEHIKGVLEVSDESVKITGSSFVLNNEPCTLDFEINDPTGELSSELTISSSKFSFISTVKKENEVYKIPEVKATCLNSSFD